MEEKVSIIEYQEVTNGKLIYILQLSLNILAMAVGVTLMLFYGGVNFRVATTKDHFLVVVGLLLVLLTNIVITANSAQYERSTER